MDSFKMLTIYIYNTTSKLLDLVEGPLLQLAGLAFIGLTFIYFCGLVMGPGISKMVDFVWRNKKKRTLMDIFGQVITEHLEKKYPGEYLGGKLSSEICRYEDHLVDKIGTTMDVLIRDEAQFMEKLLLEIMPQCDRELNRTDDNGSGSPTSPRRSKRLAKKRKIARRMGAPEDGF